MSNQPPQYAPPESPWLQKYGGWGLAVPRAPNDPVSHSGMAPMLPWLDPTFFDEDNAVFANMRPFPQPSDDELDRLFAHERAQAGFNAGLTSWELGPWVEHLVNGWPGGHRRGDPPLAHILQRGGYGVKVDETKWHPIFAKNRWYDFNVPILDTENFPNGAPGISPNDIWSVDVKAVWDELRVVIELVNRWFCCMAEDDFLNQLLYEPLQEWLEAELFHQPGPARLGPNGKPWRLRGRTTGYDKNRALQDVADAMTPVIVWTFFDENHGVAWRLGENDLYGYTTRQFNDGIKPSPATFDAMRDNTFIPIGIHVLPLRALLNPNTTLSERCHTTMSMAVTMLHELMHGINFLRTIYDPNVYDEPFYKDEWQSELGCTGINSLFGADLTEIPYTFTGRKGGVKYGFFASDYPPGTGSGARLETLNNDLVWPLGSYSHYYPLPSAWVSSVQLETFYTTVVKQYGLSAFKVPRLLASRRVHRGFYTRMHRARIIQNPQNLQGTVHDRLTSDIGKALRGIEERRLIWNQLRPWHGQEYMAWQLTPYSNTQARAAIHRFYEAVRPQSVAANAHLAELAAKDASIGMINWLNYYNMRPGDDQWPRSVWFYDVLSYMMTAVMPARQSDSGKYPTKEKVNPWYQSSTCKSQWRFPPRHSMAEDHRQEWDLPDRHLNNWPVFGPDGIQIIGIKSNRIYLLEKAVQCKNAMSQLFPLPEPLSTALEAEIHSLFHQAYTLPRDAWLEFRFRLPPYSRNFVMRDQNNNMIPFQMTTALHEDDFEMSPTALGPALAPAAQVVPDRAHRASLRITRPKTKYFTISEVGEKASNDRDGVNWALVDDGLGGYDVVDVTGLLSDWNRDLEPTALGRKVVSAALLDRIKNRGTEPLGKLLMWKHPEEVLEHDGQDGRDLWCIIGNIVYDITEFPFRSRAEKEALLAFSTNKKPQKEALEDLDMPRLVQQLAPYKCGYLRQPPPTAPLVQRTFTLRELGRHIYPEIGMYCAIDGIVYDIGRYLASHPGGEAILRQYAGRDATREFQEAHLDWVGTLESNSGLKVGRLVEERPRTDDIEDDEIALFDRVFRLTRLAITDDALYSELQPYRGTDSTDAMKGKNAPACLSQLFEQEDLICAKLVDSTRRQISMAEFRRRKHLPSKAERLKQPKEDDTDWRVWVAVAEGAKQLVFDVTVMMLFGGQKLETALRRWLGKEVEDPRLANWLRTSRESFIIGELDRGASGKHSGTAKRVQVIEPDERESRQSRAGTKRRVGGWYDDDGEIESNRSKYLKVRY